MYFRILNFLLLASSVTAAVAPKKSGTTLAISKSGNCGSGTGFTCSGSAFGNCCSKYGYCGSTAAHCESGCQGGYGTCTSGIAATSTSISVPSSNPSSTTSKISSDGTCGGSSGLTCVGSVFGSCCSQYGYCGTGSAYCSSGCQAGFGTCSDTAAVIPSASASFTTVPKPSATITSTASGTCCKPYTGSDVLGDCAAQKPGVDGSCLSTTDSKTKIIIHCGSAVGTSMSAARPNKINETDRTGLTCANECKPGNGSGCGYATMVSGDTTCAVFAKGVGTIISADPGWVVFEQTQTAACSS